MSNEANQSTELSPLKRAYLALEKLQARLEAVEQAKREPIAIIGLGCRFPGGANDPQAFWQLLRNGVDAITEVPADRWDVDSYYDPNPNVPGKMATRWGAFLDSIDQFDPQFFGISPREAASLDPQQRLLLEVAWEALEYAGQAPDQLSGSRTGVFVGIVNSDYGQLQMEAGGADHIDTYYGSGGAHSMASGRLSYILGLQGPSISIDTACSSSLVAVHLACQSLRNGECHLALAGGVNVILAPETTVALTKFHMMAPDGRCKSFDARADGFVRGEGCGLIVLKRLSDALADGDNVLAVIRGSAVNQDGPSSGLTAPNGPAQEAIIREALAEAGLTPADVGYIEAHGTGTSLGDPIEVQALANVFAEGHSKNNPLLLGSVKTNLGHLESAAGIAGLIKLALALHHQEIPPHLHLQEPNPFIPWEEIPVAVPTELTPWAPAGPLAGGVSSFGFSGTNAHVILAAAPSPQPAVAAIERPAHLLTLSGRSDKALRQLAQQLAVYLETQPSVVLADVAFTANVGRAHLPYRLALAIDSPQQGRENLTAFAAGQSLPGVASSQVESSDPPKIAFLFTGQGSQYAGMGRALYETQPTFRAALDQCDELLRPYLDVPLLSVMFGAEVEASNVEHGTLSESPISDASSTNPQSLIDQTGYTQPALFALEYALAQLWLSWGIKPDVVAGHSVGEYVAACIAGVFTLEDGLKLIAERGRLMQQLPAGGQMAAVFTDEVEVVKAIAPYADHVSIAAINGPDNVVISGAGTAVQSILEELAAAGVKSRRLTVSHAFHSPLMEPMLDGFEQTAATVTYAAPRTKLIANVTGALAMGNTVTKAAYWRDHVRQPVRFAAAVATLHELDIDCFIEIGPNPTLLAMAQRIGTADEESEAGKQPVWLPSMRQGRGDWQQLLASLATLYARGADVDWRAFDQDYPRRRLRLPTYPFQRSRYWFKGAGQRNKQISQPSSTAVHPLLGRRLRSPMPTAHFEALFHTDAFAFLADHRVFAVSILPAAAYIEMALAAAAVVLSTAAVEDMLIHEPLVVDKDATRLVQVIVTPAEDKRASFQIFSIDARETAEDWRLHASGQLGTDADALAPESALLNQIQARCQDVVTAESHYQALAEHGLDFGQSLHGVIQIWRRDGEALAQVALPEAQRPEADAYLIHPALLDACLQALAAAIPRHDGVAEAFLPFEFERFRLLGQPQAQVWSHVRLHDANNARPEMLVGDVQLLDETGQVIARLEGLRLRRADQAAVRRAAGERFDDWLYELAWQPQAKEQLDQNYFSPEDMVDHLESQALMLGEQHRLDRHRQLVNELDQLSADYILQALWQLGWTPSPGQRITAVAMANQLGVLKQHRRLLARLLAILAEDDILEQVADEEWEVVKIPAADSRPPTADLSARAAALTVDYPASKAFPALLERVGTRLAEALTGQSDPLQLLFPNGSLTLVENLYQRSPEARVFNTLAQEAMATAVSQLPAERAIRILEVGSGTGGTTASVLPILPADRTEYFFTDISPLFLSRAQEKFSDYPFVRYQLLNIEQDPATQELAEQQFDIIMAVNVLHATVDLRQTLGHVRQLLAPGGILLLLEGTAPERWIDLTFGLTDGWWRFSDSDVRSSYPLISRKQWLELLTEIGFADVTAVPASSELSDQALLIGRAPRQDEADFEHPGKWLIFADDSGVGQELAEQLQARGEGYLLVSQDAAYEMSDRWHCRIDPASSNDYRRLLEAVVTEDQPLRGVVHLWSLDVEAPAELVIDSLESCHFVGARSVLYLVQALGSAGLSPRLWLATRGTQPVTAAPLPPAVVQATLWGLGKVIALEHPDLCCTRLDLDPLSTAAQQAQTLFREISRPDQEDQVAFRNDTRYLARLVHTQIHPVAEDQVLTDEQPVALQPSGNGVLDDISLLPARRRPPGPGEVEIRILATGLNFRDVLNALAMRDDPEPLGSECGGQIVAVGEGCDRFQVGDSVIAVAPGSFGTFVTVNADLVSHKPDGLTFAEAATFPMAFLTAHYALNRLVRLSPGDRILIHAAAGGVGMAAVQLAQQAGAEIFATAGNPQKRNFLKSLGVHHVMDSRSLNFVDEILALTHGEGVDVVLNSLAGEFIPATVAVLAENGRFLEIGKRDIWSHEHFAQVRPQAAYHIVDLSAVMVEDPPVVQEMFHQLMADVHTGAIRPLPLQTFALAEAGDAFRYMAQARHIGKIVLTQTRPPAADLRPDASYLITGGLAGLGLLVAQWLVQRGARHLVLMARSRPSAAALESIAAMEAAGAYIRVVQGDVSQVDQVACILADIEATMPPLRGVIHSAGVLADGVLLRQPWSRFADVMAPKVNGSWILHALTRGKELDFFILFSSVAAVFGSPGQGNHAAANAFLDALAHHRQSLGLPALSINWGVWSHIGAAAERNVGERVAEQGVGTITPQQGLQVLDQLMRSNKAQVAVMPIDWPHYLSHFAGGAPPWLSEIDVEASARQARNQKARTHTAPAGMGVRQAAVAQEPDFWQRLVEAPVNQQRDLLLTHVHDRVVQVLGLAADHAISPRQPLNELGLDSLMAVELRNLLGTSLALKRTLPATLVFDYPTIDALTGYLARDVLALEAAVTVEADEEITANILEGIENLSDEEVEQLFAQLQK